MMDEIDSELGMTCLMHLDKHDDEVIDLKWGMMEVGLFKMDPIVLSDIACDTLKIRDNITLE